MSAGAARWTAAMRAARRARGVCYVCGLDPTPDGAPCATCRAVRSIKAHPDVTPEDAWCGACGARTGRHEWRDDTGARVCGACEPHARVDPDRPVIL